MASSVTKPVGGGSFSYSLNQVPFQAPTLTIYSNSARTIVAYSLQTLTATSNPAVWTAIYPSGLVVGTYYLSFSLVFSSGGPTTVDNNDTLVLVPVTSSVGPGQTPTAKTSFATTWAPPTAYITTAEYKAAPTAVDVSQLTLSGTGQSQDAELENVIQRASGWINSFCNQVLSSTVDVELTQATVDRYGRFKFHPDYWPILELRDFEYGSLPGQLVSLSDFTNIWINRQYVYVHPSTGFSSSQGPLQFGATGIGSRCYVRFTYVNGWPNSVLTFATTSGNNTLQLDDVTGIYGSGSTVAANSLIAPATRLTIYDGADTETISVQAVNGNVLTLNSPLVHNHSIGISVSALPPEVKQAAILLTSSLIKTRGAQGIVMGRFGEQPSKITNSEAAGLEDALIAFELIEPFRRVR